ncbi:MAG: mannitol dehydrogenase family protein [Blautia sp.]|nr:mannitol dehydrogenase family protein [Blautia sp.]
MKLSNAGIKDRKAWEAAGYALPEYDRAAVREKTLAAPRWIHFGAGNIFRAFQANVLQQLLNRGETDTGLLVAEGFDYEIIEKLNKKVDDLSILVTLKADGNVEKTVVGSIVDSFVLDREAPEDFDALKAVFENPSLQMASFTITEKGYALSGPDGKIFPAIEQDFAAGPDKACSYLGKVVSLLYSRFQAGALPIAMVSMDNCSHNGDKVYAAVNGFAKAWFENGLVSEDFVKYVNDPDKVAYPWSMIDKITPRPDAKVTEILKADGVEDLDLIVTSKKTFLSQFVNAEEAQYLIIQDWFPNGKLPLDKAGIIYTDRETVDKVEKMKVCTCLNPVHTSLAVFGCLLGYDLIAAEMKDDLLNRLAYRVGETEGLPVVVDPGIIRPVDFLTEVLTKRIPNPFMPDTPQRIACDTSQKLPIRFGETIKAYKASDPSRLAELKAVPLVFAGWLRYLLAVDDSGKEFELSPDPMLDYLEEQMKDVRLGETDGLEEKIRPLLQNASIFGIDLYEAGMAGRVVGYLAEMLEGEGAVRKTLEKYI